MNYDVIKTQVNTFARDWVNGFSLTGDDSELEELALPVEECTPLNKLSPYETQVFLARHCEYLNDGAYIIVPVSIAN